VFFGEAKHEPEGELLGQRLRGKFFQNIEEGTEGSQREAHEEGGTGRNFQVH
jgi:hypothetical protein